ncbi:hypothetical protein HAX54_048482 [Datura stramonium]|uniref:Transmembrane protein n=1 Tax=Datura stramonium TaxID=4076 RepID=A0ABS8RQG4_DATST|nr:hypothetical protein [Datura stramonium]
MALCGWRSENGSCLFILVGFGFCLMDLFRSVVVYDSGRDVFWFSVFGGEVVDGGFGVARVGKKGGAPVVGYWRWSEVRERNVRKKKGEEVAMVTRVSPEITGGEGRGVFRCLVEKLLMVGSVVSVVPERKSGLADERREKRRGIWW